MENNLFNLLNFNDELINDGGTITILKQMIVGLLIPNRSWESLKEKEKNT